MKLKYSFRSSAVTLSVTMLPTQNIYKRIQGELQSLDVIRPPRNDYSMFSLVDESGCIATDYQSIDVSKVYYYNRPQTLDILPPNQWNESQLEKLNVQVIDVSFDEFFAKLGNENDFFYHISPRAQKLIEDLSDLNEEYLKIYATKPDITWEELVDRRKELMSNSKAHHPILKNCYLMKKYKEHESAVDSLVSLLLMHLGFYDDLLFVLPQLRLSIKYGESDKRESKGDFTILDILNFYRMAVIEDKNFQSEDMNSLPQLCAELIALYQHNGETERALKRIKLGPKVEDQMKSPLVGIRVNGKYFNFYLFSMSEQIETAMKTQTKANEPTKVYRLGTGFQFFDKEERKTIISILDCLQLYLTEISSNAPRMHSNDRSTQV
jgi:hypothetical protein